MFYFKHGTALNICGILNYLKRQKQLVAAFELIEQTQKLSHEEALKTICAIETDMTHSHHKSLPRLMSSICQSPP